MIRAVPAHKVVGDSGKPGQVKKQPTPTAGMNIAQRILHVGGRNNAAGYVEFGSIHAVAALVRHVLRDMREIAPIPDSVLVDMYDERPSSDADMIDFARAVEAAHGIEGQHDHSRKHW